MKAYSYDLRIRIFNYSLTHSIQETAQVFRVSPNTVYLLKQLFFKTGSLEPYKRTTWVARLITPEGEQYLQLLLAEEVDLTLEELGNRYEEAYGVRVSIGTLYNTLKKLNITRKKKTFSDPKKKTRRVKMEKENYDEQLEKIEPEKRFYLDETGSCINMSPAYGRSKRGHLAYDEKPTYSSDKVSTVAVLTEEGIKAHYSYSVSLTARVFICYLDTFVLPLLNDGQTLIMDNHPVHHAKIVQKYTKQNHINVLFLPPYSPELNPIEEAFSKIKTYIKKQKARTLDKLLIVINDAFNIITNEDAHGYFNHAAQF
jgi:transposase